MDPKSFVNSNWPAIGQFEECHTGEDGWDTPSPSYPNWLMERAGKIFRKCEDPRWVGPQIPEMYHEYYRAEAEDILLIAEHLSDHYRSNSHQDGICLTIGCDNFADGANAIGCPEHQPVGDRELPAPYGFDGGDLTDPDVEIVEFEDYTTEYEKVSWKRTKKSFVRHEYTTEERTHEITLKED
tara:strand:- start:124 stop:672 length:549 start_codon:yes stop_codon:yes gene_type:complete